MKNIIYRIIPYDTERSVHVLECRVGDGEWAWVTAAAFNSRSEAVDELRSEVEGRVLKLVNMFYSTFAPRDENDIIMMPPINPYDLDGVEHVHFDVDDKNRLTQSGAVIHVNKLHEEVKSRCHS